MIGDRSPNPGVDEFGPPGAIPPTAGAAPEDAPPAQKSRTEHSAAEDLVDGIDLLLRAARKAMGELDPELERSAQLALERLRALDEEVTRNFHERAAVVAPRLERVARETGREVVDVLRRLADRIEANAKPYA
jgi:hypothetical protein